jgi:hypothetical protein
VFQLPDNRDKFWAEHGMSVAKAQLQDLPWAKKFSNFL